MSKWIKHAALAAPILATLLCVGEGRADTVNNPIAMPITLDGLFTNGVPTPGSGREWSDVTPLAFVAPSDPMGTLFRAPLGDPRVNSLLYAAIAPGTSAPSFELYLMYDYLGRTNLNFAPGEFVADIRFPLGRAARPMLITGDDITVQIRGSNFIASSFDVFVDLDNNGTPDALASQFGIEAGVNIGPSLLSLANHLQIELEVPLLAPPGFFTFDGSQGGFPGEGGRGYSPAPAFWGASSAKDVGDPPISSAIFQLNPDGSTTASNNNVPLIGPSAVPEPASLLLVGVGLGAVGLSRLRRKKA